MERLERLYYIDSELRSGRALSCSDMMGKFEISRPTAMRDIEHLRLFFGLSVVYCRAQNGYIYDMSDDNTARFELPKIQLTSDELKSLILIHNLLDTLAPGVLSAQIKSIRERVESMLAGKGVDVSEISDRFRLLASQRRRMRNPEVFGRVCSALLDRRQLEVTYGGRRSDDSTLRRISPQRLVMWRGNFYVDAYCHLRNALRSFAVDAIESVRTVHNGHAIEVPKRDMEKHLCGSYGIFSGAPRARATIRFSANIAPWVSAEDWHPDQQGSFDERGRYVLTVPYNEDTELVGDILKFGSESEVLSPQSLRAVVAAKLSAALDLYSKPAGPRVANGEC